MSSTEQGPKIRVCSLDLLRFLAAVSVMFYHYATANSFCRYGYMGVSVFFMISGFVISMSAQGRTWQEFVISRICRLYPAFWVCCTITFFFLCLFPHTLSAAITNRTLTEYWLNLTMFPRLLRIQFIDGVYWTLQVEAIFYFFIFLNLLLFGFQRFKQFLNLWAAVTLVNLFLKNKIIGLVFATDNAPFFIIGAVFYLAAKEHWNVKKILLHVTMFSVACLRLYTTPIVFSINPVTSILIFAVTNVLFLLISLDMVKVKSSAFTFLGAATYPLYLIHNCIGLILLKIIPLPRATRLVLVSIIMVASSLVIAFLIEKPLARRLKAHMTWIMGLFSTRREI
jgi:peptidoglycan/LPS O-acetylase OafA/YrhL